MDTKDTIDDNQVAPQKSQSSTNHSYADLTPTSDGKYQKSGQVEDEKHQDPEQTEGEKPDITIPLRSKRMVLILSSLSLCMFITGLDMTIVATALPTIAEKFNSLSSINWVATSFLLAITTLQPLYGGICDILGRVNTLLLAMLIFLIGSALCGASSSIGMLIGSRAIAGIGAAGLVSITFVVCSDITTEMERGIALGIMSAVYSCSMALGPIIGGAFSDSSAGWRWVFYFSLPVGGLSFILVAVFLRLPREGGSLLEKFKRLDVLGVSVLIGGLVMFLLGLSFGGNEHPWVSATVLCLMIIGLLMVGSFVIIEWKVSPFPIMPMRLFKNRNVALIFLGQIGYGAALFASIYYIPIWFSTVKNVTAIKSGVHLLPAIIPAGIFSVITGFAIEKTGRYLPFIWVGCCLYPLGFGLLALLKPDSGEGMQYGLVVILGVSIGMVMQTTLIALQASVDSSDMSITTVLYTTVQACGGTIGLTVSQVIQKNLIKSKLETIATQYPKYAAAIVATAENQGIIYSASIPTEVKDGIITAYADTIRVIFFTMIGFSGLYAVTCFCLRHVPLRSGAVHAAIA